MGRTIPELVSETVAAAGCEVVELRELANQTVRVMVDREPGGVTVDLLGDVTRALNDAFEREGLDPGDYTIEVLSPGIDRPLIRDKDFERFRGAQVHVKLREKRSLDGRRNYRGALIGLQEGRVVVANPDDPEPWRFAREELREVRLVPELPRGLEEDAPGRKRRPTKSRRKRPKEH